MVPCLVVDSKVTQTMYNFACSLKRLNSLVVFQERFEIVPQGIYTIKLLTLDDFSDSDSSLLLLNSSDLFFIPWRYFLCLDYTWNGHSLRTRPHSRQLSLTCLIFFVAQFKYVLELL